MPRGVFFRSGGLEAVADPGLGVNEAGTVGISFELPAQAADVDIHRAWTRLKPMPQNLSQDRRSGNNHPGVLHQ